MAASETGRGNGTPTFVGLLSLSCLSGASRAFGPSIEACAKGTPSAPWPDSIWNPGGQCPQQPLKQEVGPKRPALRVTAHCDLAGCPFSCHARLARSWQALTRATALIVRLCYPRQQGMQPACLPSNPNNRWIRGGPGSWPRSAENRLDAANGTAMAGPKVSRTEEWTGPPAMV
jgi:hypothetical protein